MKTKKLAILICIVLVLVVGVGATLAWLTDKSGPVTNTFTPSTIDIELDETKQPYQMVPGHTIDKDPIVTVKAGSEACYLFVKVVKSDNFDDYMTYENADVWTLLEDDGIDDENVAVYYREQSEVPANADPLPAYSVLKNNKVMVNSDVTKEMMDKIIKSEDPEPTLTFTAYATQLYKTNPETDDNKFSVTDAWKVAQGKSLE